METEISNPNKWIRLRIFKYQYCILETDGRFSDKRTACNMYFEFLLSGLSLLRLRYPNPPTPPPFLSLSLSPLFWPYLGRIALVDYLFYILCLESEKNLIHSPLFTSKLKKKKCL